ncbi:MAG: ABC transporter permease [Firmicutes bacterium]|nr:ABC transporter permease [Bacillota bacterium]
MAEFKAAYINELYKLSKRKKITVSVIMSLSVIAVGALITCTVNSFMGINLAGKSEFSIMMLPVFVNIVIPLFAAFVCIDIFCGELSGGTIKTTLLAPASRLKVFLAKTAAATTFSTAMLMFAMLVSFAVSVVIGHTEFKVLRIFAAYIVSAVPLCAVCLMAALVCNIAKGSGMSFMLCFIVFMVFKTFEVIYPAYSTFFFTSGLSMYVLVYAPLIGFAKLLRMLLVSAGWCIMLFSAGYMVFETKEI